MQNIFINKISKILLQFHTLINFPVCQIKNQGTAT